MSEININQTDLNITVTPNTTTLSVYTGGYACAQGNTTEVQFNNGGVIAGANGLTYDQGSQTTTAANLTVTNNTDLGAIGNITITGGNSGEVLTTDGSGGLSFSEIANANFASFAGNVIEPAQPNITSVGNLSNLTVTGNVTANYFIGNGSQLTGIGDGTSISNGTSNVRVLSANGNIAIGVNGNANVLVATATGIQVPAANLGSVSNLVITGGNNGFVLQTDGTGNLTWTAMTGNAGNGVVGGSNTQVQYNDGGAFGGSAGFTFDKASNLLSVPGGVTAVGNVQGNYIKGDGGLLSNIPGGGFISNGNSNVVVDANSNVRIAITGQANIVDVGLATVTVTKDLEVTGNFVVTNGNIVKSGTGRYIGNASGLSQIPGANVTGTVANATYATNAGTVTTAAQPNITSLGTLTSLGVSGNITAPNIVANTGIFSGNANGLTSIPAGNIVGTVANATHAVTANTVVNASQPNITSVGTLTSLAVNGNITAANITANTGVFTGNGSGLSAIAGANVSGQVANALVAGTVYTNAQPNITSVGTMIGLTLTANADITMSGVGSQLSGANLVSANFISGTLTTNAQPNITSIGTLQNLNVNSGGVGGQGNITTDGNIIMSSGLRNLWANGCTGTFENITVTGNLTANVTGNSIGNASIFVFANTANNSVTLTGANVRIDTDSGVGLPQYDFNNTSVTFQRTLAFDSLSTNANAITAGAFHIRTNANVYTNNISVTNAVSTNTVSACTVSVLGTVDSYIIKNQYSNVNVNAGTTQVLSNTVAYRRYNVNSNGAANTITLNMANITVGANTRGSSIKTLIYNNTGNTLTIVPQVLDINSANQTVANGTYSLLQIDVFGNIDSDGVSCGTWLFANV